MARRSRSRSRSREHQKRHRSRSRSRERSKRDRDRERDRGGREEKEERRQQYERKEVTKAEHAQKAEALKPEPPPKEGVNLGLSGALTEETNTYNGVVIKYSEPPEARKPKRRWRFYVFKGEEVLPTLHVHRQSAFLMGRDRKVCDLPIDHPSCSKQHAVFQYRLVSKRRDDGSEGNRVVPYIIDLGSANGTYLNNTRIEANRYYELKEKDVLKFGYSTREYVLLHEESG
eukprot:TRINITY_DN3848_c0_g1_i2.p1 TRINITY_DN3848_c0_g1~~TRINITY_DN3848_c0_g1_i2.p1  ORF type:complete len:230 (+),score=51.64 TRINITY_DN3848_c0_g1_i2:115-804(+)